MKIGNIALASVLAVALVGGSVAAQSISATSVHADEIPSSSAQFDRSIVEGTVEKDEVVYASMTASGAVKHLYVVNELFSDEPVLVRDFGTYTALTNLTDESALAQEADSVLCVIEDGSFTYQGNLESSELPWSVKIAYKLDGVAISPEELAGKSGELRISIETERNDALDPIYFDNYLLQITATLPIDRATHIETQEGSIALAGSDTTVTFTGMPGKSGSYELTAQVKDFEMSGLQIAAIPFAMALDLPDSSALTAQFDELIAGVGQLDEGAQKLVQGSADLEQGADAFDQGAAQLQDGAHELSAGLAAYIGGVARVKEGIAQAAAGSRVFASKLEELSRSSEDIVSSLESAETQIQAIVARIQGSTLPDAEKQALLQQVMAMSAQLGGLKDYAAGVGQLSSAYAQIDSSLSSLSSGLEELSQQGEQLAGGSEQLAGGADDLAGSTALLSQGAEQLVGGVAGLADGTAELHEETQRIPEKLQAEIDAMMSAYDKSDFTPVSFVDARNKKVKLVQFVMSTEGIRIPDPEPEMPEQEDETLLSRFFALFS